MSLAQRYRPFTLKRQDTPASAMTEPTYTTVGTYRGFIQPVSGNESTLFSKVDENYSHRLYTGLDTPVEYGDRIEQDGLTWRAVETKQPRGVSAVQHHKEILLEYV